MDYPYPILKKQLDLAGRKLVIETGNLNKPVEQFLLW